MLQSNSSPSPQGRPSTVTRYRYSVPGSSPVSRRRSSPCGAMARPGRAPRRRRSATRRRTSRRDGTQKPPQATSALSCPSPARCRNSSKCCSKPATPGSAVVVLVALADVLGDAPLEQLELLVELVGGDRLAGFRRAQQPRRRVDGGAPGDLVGVVRVGGLGRRLRRRLDGVEVDILEAVALLLVEADVRPEAPEPHRLLADPRAERRVLLARVVGQDPAGLARARLHRLHVADLHLGLHAPGLPGTA